MIQFVNSMTLPYLELRNNVHYGEEAEIVPQFNLSSLILSIYRDFLFHLIISKFQLLFSTSKKNTEVEFLLCLVEEE